MACSAALVASASGCSRIDSASGARSAPATLRLARSSSGAWQVRAVRYRWRAARSPPSRPSATWGQTLGGAQLRPLVHCVRPCGARSANGSAPIRYTIVRVLVRRDFTRECVWNRRQVWPLVTRSTPCCWRLMRTPLPDCTQSFSSASEQYVVCAKMYQRCWIARGHSVLHHQH